MIRALLLLLLSAPVLAQEGSSERGLVERWRSLPDQERARLREAFRRFRALPPEEQQRIRENFQRLRQLSPELRERLRSRFRSLTPEQRARLADTASTLTGFMKSRYDLPPEGFPRGMFFGWLKRARPDDFEKIQELGPQERKEVFVKHYIAFYRSVIEETERHAREHRCISEDELKELREVPVPEFWSRWHELRMRDRGRRPEHRRP